MISIPESSHSLKQVILVQKGLLILNRQAQHWCPQSGVQTVSYLRNIIGVKIFLISPLASLFFNKVVHRTLVVLKHLLINSPATSITHTLLHRKPPSICWRFTSTLSRAPLMPTADHLYHNGDSSNYSIEYPFLNIWAHL